MKTMNISDTLANNISMAKLDEEYYLTEKSTIADAMYAIQMAKANFDNDKAMLDKLDDAMNVVMSYLYHLELFKNN